MANRIRETVEQLVSTLFMLFWFGVIVIAIGAGLIAAYQGIMQ